MVTPPVASKAGAVVIAAAVLALGAATQAQTPSPAPPRPGSGVLAHPPAADAAATRRENATISIQDIAHLDGQGRSPLHGLGIVLGLKNTGDSGSELALARPLAQAYANVGNPLPELKDLAKAKSAALVWVDCTVQESGAHVGDVLDVKVSAAYGASSLEGGTLIISPLTGPIPGDPIWAYASGPIVTEDAKFPTVGRIRRGAMVVRDISMPAITGSFNLVVDPNFRGWTTVRALAIQIADLRSNPDAPAEGQNAPPPIAKVLDEMTIQVTIPADERADPANFIASVLSSRFSPALLDLPAMIIINERAGTIVATGDVELSPVAIAFKDMVVTTTIPPPVGTPNNPLIQREQWVAMQTTGRPSERARMQDLLQAFKQMAVPVHDQMEILSQIHRSGRLNARLIIE